VAAASCSSRVHFPIPSAFADLKSRVGTEVAHLSYQRVPLTEDALKWPVSDIFKGLLAVLQAFLAEVPRERVDHDRYFGSTGTVPPATVGKLPVTIPRWPFPK
jgi:hypothetical protein